MITHTFGCSGRWEYMYYLFYLLLFWGRFSPSTNPLWLGGWYRLCLAVHGEGGRARRRQRAALPVGEGADEQVRHACCVVCQIPMDCYNPEEFLTQALTGL